MAWNPIASIQGPQGEQGPTGSQGPKGDTGDTGPAGVDGAGIEIEGQVDTYEDLPSEGNDPGDGYLVDADGLLYIWGGSSFPADGEGVEFRGPKGDKGDKGDQGDVGPTGEQGIQGATGATGSTGGTGADGARGSLWYSGSGAPTSIGGQQAGDMYLDTDDGQVYQLG